MDKLFEKISNIIWIKETQESKDPLKSDNLRLNQKLFVRKSWSFTIYSITLCPPLLKFYQKQDNMKKLLLTFLGALLTVSGARADEPVNEFGVFKHMSVGIGIGTTGLGFQVAFPITDYLALRGGYSFLPSSLVDPTFTAKYTHDGGIKDETKVGTKLHMGDGDILIDIHPGKKTGFHFTTGFFVGKEKLITAKNTSPIYGAGPGEGLIIGDYTIGIAADGIARAAIKVNKFKPYVGFGYGRAVPRKRVNFAFDLGVMFWGKPEVWGSDVNDPTHFEPVPKASTGEEAAQYWKYLEKVKVYPVLTFRLNGRLF